MKRRTLSLVLACALSVALLSACGSKGNDSSVSGSSSGSLLPDGSVSSSASEGPAQPTPPPPTSPSLTPPLPTAPSPMPFRTQRHRLPVPEQEQLHPVQGGGDLSPEIYPLPRGRQGDLLLQRREGGHGQRQGHRHRPWPPAPP